MAYGQSKLANIMFAYDLASRLANTGVTVHCIHPGLVKSDLRRHVDEYMLSHSILKYFYPLTTALDYSQMSTESGALTQLYAATSKKLNGKTGYYFTPIGIHTNSSAISHNKEMQSALWNISMSLTSNYAPIEV